MANRHRRRRTIAPGPSSSSGTGPPDPARTAEILEFRQPAPEPPPPWFTAYGPVTIGNEQLQARFTTVDTAARRSLEAMGFVFPRPGEAFEELGGTRPVVDPRT